MAPSCFTSPSTGTCFSSRAAANSLPANCRLRRVVNVCYLRHCLHESHQAWRSFTLGWQGRCTSCKMEVFIEGCVHGCRLLDDVVVHVWSQEHVKTAASPVNGAQLKYALERDA